VTRRRCACGHLDTRTVAGAPPRLPMARAPIYGARRSCHPRACKGRHGGGEARCPDSHPTLHSGEHTESLRNAVRTYAREHRALLQSFGSPCASSPTPKQGTHAVSGGKHARPSRRASCGALRVQMSVPCGEIR